MKLPKTIELVFNYWAMSWDVKHKPNHWACVSWFDTHFDIPTGANRLWLTVYDRPGNNRVPLTLTAYDSPRPEYLYARTEKSADVISCMKWLLKLVGKQLYVGVEYACEDRE